MNASIVPAQTNPVIEKIDGKFYLQDGQTHNNLLPKGYDEIKFEGNFYVVRLNGRTELFNKQFQNMGIKKFKVMFQNTPYSSYYQMLADNKLIVVHESGKKIDSLPVEYLTRSVCGTVSRYTQSIYRIGDSTFIKLRIKPPTNPEIDDAVVIIKNITELINKDTLVFLNNANSYYWDANNEFSVALSPNVFFVKKANEKMDIAQIDIRDSVLKKKILVADIDKDLSFNGYMPTKYFYIFRFRQNGLYGYYPMMRTGRYKKLERFTGHFARFTLSKRKKGWIDESGNEYLD